MNTFTYTTVVAASAFVISACAAAAQPSTTAVRVEQGRAAPSTPAKVPTVLASASGMITVTGAFNAPESVLYDAQADVYLVSNINGSPFAEDDNGFVAQVAPDGRVLNARWIDGATTNVVLNAPKGMALVGETLYVADLTVVRRFDRRSGQAQGEIPIAGATFLNDLVAAPDGTLYVSDPGLQATADGFREAGNDAIYQIAPDGSVSTWAKGTALGHPNGLALLPDGTLRANTLNTSRDVYTIAHNGAPRDIQLVPGGQLDGLIVLDDGSTLVSSWETKTIYRLYPNGKATSVFSDPQSPAADIGYDAGRKRLLIPLFSANTVLIASFAA